MRETHTETQNNISVMCFDFRFCVGVFLDYVVD
jgi:hypothetical protein